MTDMFKCLAELDVGQQAAATSTASTMQEMLREVLAEAESYVVLKDEIVTDKGNSSGWKQVGIKQNLSHGELTELERRARKGYRLAVLLINAGKVLHALESRGYERCKQTSLGSISLVGGWTTWLNQHFPDVQGALVFGHDLDPIFVFENSKRKQRQSQCENDEPE